MKNYDRMGKGLDGEQWVSEALDELKMSHEHHDFSSVTAYAQTQGEGVDLWDNSSNFHIEVKHFPNSYLCGTGSYYAHIDPRFRDIPINGLKLVIQIKGWKNKSFISKCRQQNIYYIYVDDPKKLVSKLGYFLRVHGVLPYKDSTDNDSNSKDSHKNECYIADLAHLDTERPVHILILDADGDIQDKGPPDSTSSLANLGSWVSFNNIGIGKDSSLHPLRISRP